MASDRSSRATVRRGGDTQAQLVFVSDRRDADQSLRQHYDVSVCRFDAVEGQLAALPSTVVVIDAVDRPRLAEVAAIALGGMRGVLVIGPQTDAAQAMRYLDVGAADYLSCRATPAELLARVRAVVRATASGTAGDALMCGSVTISLDHREVRREGKLIHLTPTEFAILEALARQPGTLVSHAQLMASVYGGGVAASHYLRRHIRQLRAKIEDNPATPRWIQTERGAGYRLIVEDGFAQGRAASA